MRRAFVLLISFVLFLFSLQLLAQGTTLPTKPKVTSAKRLTVCGIVASAHYAASSKGQPTFVNLDKPYPNQIFTVLIWGSDRGNRSAQK